MGHKCWIERKTNKLVLRTGREKRMIIDSVRARRYKMVAYTLRRLEELYKIIVKCMIERTKTSGRPQNSYII